MSFEAMTWACRQELACAKKMVLLMLADRVNKDTGVCVPSVKLLAKDCGLSEASVKRHLKELSDDGFITVRARFKEQVQLANEYRLNISDASSVCDHGVHGEPTRGSQRTHPGFTMNPPGAHGELQNQELNQEDNQYVPGGTPDRPEGKNEGIAAFEEKVIDLYHEHLPELPKVRVIGSQRKKAIAGWLSWILKSKRPDGTRRADNVSEAIDWVEGYFLQARLNDFVMGRIARADKHSNWVADIDYLMTERGMRQVIEKTMEAA